MFMPIGIPGCAPLLPITTWTLPINREAVSVMGISIPLSYYTIPPYVFLCMHIVYRCGTSQEFWICFNNVISNTVLNYFYVCASVEADDGTLFRFSYLCVLCILIHLNDFGTRYQFCNCVKNIFCCTLHRINLYVCVLSRCLYSDVAILFTLLVYTHFYSCGTSQ